MSSSVSTASQGKKQSGSFKTSVCAQFHNESMLGACSILFFEDKPEPLPVLREKTLQLELF